MIPSWQVLMRNRRKILIWTGVLLAIYALVGFLAVPPILKSVLTKQLTAALRRDVRIREVRVNPFTLSTTLRGLAVKEPTGPESFVSLEELYLNLETSSLFRWAVVIREIHLTKPFIRVVRRQDESYNFSDLLVRQGAQPTPATKPLRFSLNNIRITDGGVDLEDQPVQTKHTVRELNVGIPFLSTIPSQVETFVQPGLSALINGTRYAVGGRTKPFAGSQETTLDVDIADLDLPHYLAYVPRDLMNFALPSGKLDARFAIIFLRRGATGPALTVKGDLGLRQLAVDDTRGNPVLRIPTLDIGLASVEPLLRRAHLSRISLQSPELTVRREKTGVTNLETLLPRPVPPREPANQTASSGEPVVLDVDEIRMAGAKVLFLDQATGLPFKTTLAPIDLTVLQLSTRPDAKGTYSLALKTEAKEEIALEGSVSLTPLVVDGKVAAKSIPLKKYTPYYYDLVRFDLESGKLDLSSRYRYAQGSGEPDMGASEAAISLSGLRLKARNTDQEFLNIPALTIKSAGLDLSNREVSISSVSTQRGAVLVSRSREGEVNLANLLPRATAAVSSLAGGPEAGSPRGTPERPERPWVVKTGTVSLNEYRIQVTDEGPHEPVSLVVEDVNLKAQNLSTTQNQTGKVSLAFRLNNGTFSSEGAVGLTPVAADLQLALKELDLRPFHPYVTDRVKVTVAEGRVSTTGRLALSIKEPAGLQATFTGELSIGSFAALEKATAEDLLRWESLSLREISAGHNPFTFHAKRVVLADFFAKVIIQADGMLNLQDILEKDGQPQSAPEIPMAAKAEDLARPAAAHPGGIQIEEVTLQGGRIQFADRSLKPNYSAEMMEIGGRISGLSSEETSRAEVELRGKLNNSSPLEVTGRINPLKQDLFVDLRARFTGMDLSPTSPYSGKYVGYSIEKGKLSFDLRYLIEKRKLESENKVFVDQLTFGEKVDSPTATSLPVKLAVALLKDRNGEIHLDLPVMGSLDDPKFDVWQVILQILGNLIAKAATSPFALLGAAFGGGEELQYLEFDYGRTSISEQNLKKIEVLATALSEKPSLHLEIAGHVDLEADREGLKQYLLQRKVKAQKLNDLVKQGSPPASVDEVAVAPGEYETYLTRAYRAEKFPKPRNIIGMVKSLPVPEMEKLILTHIEVGEEELRLLASQRANAVKETILRSGKVEADRLFIVQPTSLAPEKKENQKDSRVEFKIG
jgi:uncharacterized protein involved in outer membrane biogenesis